MPHQDYLLCQADAEKSCLFRHVRFSDKHWLVNAAPVVKPTPDSSVPGRVYLYSTKDIVLAGQIPDEDLV